MQEYKANKDSGKTADDDVFIYSGEELPITGKLHDELGGDVDFGENSLVQLEIRSIHGVKYKVYSSSPIGDQEQLNVSGNTFSAILKKELTRHMVGLFVFEVKLVKDGSTMINVLEPILFKNNCIKREKEVEE